MPLNTPDNDSPFLPSALKEKGIYNVPAGQRGTLCQYFDKTAFDS